MVCSWCGAPEGMVRNGSFQCARCKRFTPLVAQPPQPPPQAQRVVVEKSKHRGTHPHTWITFGLIMLVISLVCVGVSGRDDKKSESGVPSLEKCVAAGERHFRDIGSWPRLSDGRAAARVVRERCGRSRHAFSD